MTKLRLCLFLILALCAATAAPQTAQTIPFQPFGDTITFTASTTGSAPKQATTTQGTFVQYVVTNVGAVTAFVAYGSTSGQAGNACTVPTGGSPSAVVPILTMSQVTITTSPNGWFCGVTGSSTAVIYVTPGQGQ